MRKPFVIHISETRNFTIEVWGETAEEARDAGQEIWNNAPKQQRDSWQLPETVTGFSATAWKV